MLELFINNEFICEIIKDNFKITVQNNDIAELSSRQSSYTNSFNIPRTAPNVHYLDELGQVGDLSRKPYQNLQVDIYESSVLILKNGFLEITETTQTEYRVNVRSGIVDFFKKIDGLEFSSGITLPLTITARSFGSYNENSPYFKFLLADYGGQTHINGTTINIDYLAVSYPVTYVWDQVFEQLGYQYEGNIFTTTDFTELYIMERDPEQLAGLSVKDFVKEIINMFGLTIYVNENGVFVFKTFNERMDGEVVDWSNKYKQRTSETYLDTQYAQKNKFKHKYNDEKKTYSDGSLLIDNENLNNEKEILTSFSYSESEFYSSFYLNAASSDLVKEFRFYDKDLKDTGIEYKPLEGRYYFVRLKSTETTIQIGTNDLPSPVFSTVCNVARTKYTTYKELVPRYYNNLEVILNDFRLHKIELFVNKVDMYNIDLSKVYYFDQEQMYYFLNRLGYEGCKVSKAEFVRIDKSKLDLIVPEIIDNLITILDIVFELVPTDPDYILKLFFVDLPLDFYDIHIILFDGTEIIYSKKFGGSYLIFDLYLDPSFTMAQIFQIYITNVGTTNIISNIFIPN